MNDRAIIRSFEAGTGKRLAIVALVVAVIALLAVVTLGFHGRHIARNAAALTRPAAVEIPPRTPPPFPSR
jgi:hypothetical protein